jgi:hypothetical protein
LYYADDDGPSRVGTAMAAAGVDAPVALGILKSRAAAGADKRFRELRTAKRWPAWTARRRS